jgi:hypothetical protein
MECDQRVIIRFLHNERAYAHDIAYRLQAQTSGTDFRHRLQARFAQNAYVLRTVQFWIGEVRRDHQDLHDENRMETPLLDDLDARILAILDKFPFESALSITETLRVGLTTVL